MTGDTAAEACPFTFLDFDRLRLAYERWFLLRLLRLVDDLWNTVKHKQQISFYIVQLYLKSTYFKFHSASISRIFWILFMPFGSCES